MSQSDLETNRLAYRGLARQFHKGGDMKQLQNAVAVFLFGILMGALGYWYEFLR